MMKKKKNTGDQESKTSQKKEGIGNVIGVKWFHLVKRWIPLINSIN